MEKYRKVLHELIEKIDSEAGLKRLFRFAQHIYIHMKRGWQRKEDNDGSWEDFAS